MTDKAMTTYTLDLVCFLGFTGTLQGIISFFHFNLLYTLLNKKTDLSTSPIPRYPTGKAHSLNLKFAKSQLSTLRNLTPTKRYFQQVIFD